jgi:hypothetical protein
LHNGNFDDDEEYSSSEEYADSNDSNDDDEDDDDDYENENEIDAQEAAYGLGVEQPGKVIVDRELEWDDTSLEIKIRDKQLQKERMEQEIKLSKSFSNKKSNNI